MLQNHLALVALWTNAGKRLYAKIPNFSGFNRWHSCCPHVGIPIAPHKFHRENRSAGRIARHVSIPCSLRCWRVKMQPHSEAPEPRTVESKTNGPSAIDPSAEVSESGSDSHRSDPASFEYNLLRALHAMRVGDFSVRMAGDEDGLPGKIADTFNEIAAANQRIAEQLEGAGV